MRLSTIRRKFLIFIVISCILWFMYRILELFYEDFVAKQSCPDDERIDVVYTWVNGSDPEFRETLFGYFRSVNLPVENKYLGQRYDDKQELKFSLRSIEKYAPWINKVFIVTNGQIPAWLNLDYKRVKLVTHKELFLDQSDLPSFSSPAIETHLHRIPGLSKKFLYFNDDLFLGQPVYKEDFISSNNGYMLYLSYPLGACAEQCLWVYVADGQCDEACNNSLCQYDGGDCDEEADSTDNKNVPKISSILKNNSNENRVIVKEYNRKVVANEKIKKKRFQRRQRKLKTMKSLHKYNEKIGKSNVSSCAYSASLQHSNRIFNLKYGFIPRFVPAHTPLLIDTAIMGRLERKFFKELLITSRNKVRSPNDLQFTFTYYYFIIHERRELAVGDIFNLFDSDASGTWSDREIRTLLTRIYRLPLSYVVVDQFESMLLNCSSVGGFKQVEPPPYERYADSRLPTISKELVESCAELRNVLTEQFSVRKKYKYQIVKNSGNQQIHFKQLRSNLTELVGQLDEIRSEPRKFNCLNDNLDHDETGDSELIESIIEDFYVSLFPFPSKFELAKEYRNRFLNVDELNRWKSRHNNIKLSIHILLVIVIYVICCKLCTRRLCCLVINKLFY